MIWLAFAIIVIFQIDTHRRMARLERSIGGVIHRQALQGGMHPHNASRL